MPGKGRKLAALLLGLAFLPSLMGAPAAAATAASTGTAAVSTGTSVAATDWAQKSAALDAVGPYTYSDGLYLPAYDLYTPEEALFSQGLAPVCAEGKWGFIRADGTFAIPPRFDTAESFSDGLALVTANARRVFIDDKGETVLDVSGHDSVGSFVQGLAPFAKGGKYGFIDRKGQTVIPAEWDFVSAPADERILVEKNGLYGYLTPEGTEVIPPKYGYAVDFAGGAAWVELDGEGLLIDPEGQVLARGVYSGVRDGLAMVQADGLWGFVDAAGEEVIPCRWKDVELPAEGLLGVREDVLWGFADYSGAVVIPAAHAYIWPFSDSMAMVASLASDGYAVDRYGYIDRVGHLAVEMTYYDARPFSDGLAAVSDGAHWGYVDKTGKLVIDLIYDYAAPFAQGLAVVGLEGKFRLIDKTGATLTLRTEAEAPPTATTSAGGMQTAAPGQATTAAVPQTPADGEENLRAAEILVMVLAGVLLIFVAVVGVMRSRNIRRREAARREKIRTPAVTASPRDPKKYYIDED